MAEEYDQIRRTVEVMVPKGLALDVGCGTGYWSQYLRSQGWAVVGTDFSPEMLRQAKLGAKMDEAAYVCASMTSLPFRSGAFKLAICFWVLQSLTTDSQLRRGLGELKRVLRQAGTLFVTDNLSDADGSTAQGTRLVVENWRLPGDSRPLSTYRCLRNPTKIRCFTRCFGFTPREFYEKNNSFFLLSDRPA